MATPFRHRGLNSCHICFITEALLRCRVAVVAKLKNWRVPSSGDLLQFDGLLGVEAVVPAAVGQVKVLDRVVLVPLEAGAEGIGRGPGKSRSILEKYTPLIMSLPKSHNCPPEGGGLCEYVSPPPPLILLLPKAHECLPRNG